MNISDRTSPGRRHASRTLLCIVGERLSASGSSAPGSPSSSGGRAGRGRHAAGATRPGLLDLVGSVYAGLARVRRVAVAPLGDRRSPRPGAPAGLAAASMVLDAGWLLVTQQALAVGERRGDRGPGGGARRAPRAARPTSARRRRSSSGWSSTGRSASTWAGSASATCANVAATLGRRRGHPGGRVVADAVAVVVLGVVVGVAALVLARTGRRWTLRRRGRLGPGLDRRSATGWPSRPASTVVGLASALAAAAVLLLAARAQPAPGRRQPTRRRRQGWCRSPCPTAM